MRKSPQDNLFQCGSSTILKYLITLAVMLATFMEEHTTVVNVSIPHIAAISPTPVSKG